MTEATPLEKSAEQIPGPADSDLEAKKRFSIIERAQKVRENIIEKGLVKILSKLDEHPTAKKLALKGLDYTVVGTYTMTRKAMTGENIVGEKVPQTDRILYALAAALAVAAKMLLAYGLIEGSGDQAVVGGIATVASYGTTGLTNIIQAIRTVKDTSPAIIEIKNLAEKTENIQKMLETSTYNKAA